MGLPSQNRGKNLRLARDLARQNRQERVHRAVDVKDVEDVLGGPCSMNNAKDMLAKVSPPVVSPTRALDVKNFNIRQQLPQFKAMLSLDKAQGARCKVQGAIRPICDKNSALDLLAYWPDFVYARLEHLELMGCIINAKN
ncbi:hypothetical protein BBJ28_00019213 [Nothophytophthora sp. Chile5]|nr:hypothetical protein BBJ28_00019213 [Nothophytophthora sp. Chile5]